MSGVAYTNVEVLIAPLNSATYALAASQTASGLPAGSRPLKRMIPMDQAIQGLTPLNASSKRSRKSGLRL